MVAQFTIGFKPQRMWSSLAAIDFFLGGTGAGAFLVSIYLGVNAGAVAGIVAVILGAIALLADLGRPERFWRAGARIVLSWISRGVFFTSVFVVFSILYIAPDSLAVLPWSRATGLGQGIGVVAALGAIGIMMYTGFLLSHSPSIPFWNTTLLPLLFASSALTCGAGTVFVMLPLLGERATNLSSAAGMGIALLGANLILLAVYVLNANASTVAARESVRILMRGRLAMPFLIGVILIGLIAPLVLAIFSYNSGSGSAAAPMLAIAGVLVLVGGYLFRHCVLKAGVYAPIL